jgi:hypothetical protein
MDIFAMMNDQRISLEIKRKCIIIMKGGCIVMMEMDIIWGMIGLLLLTVFVNLIGILLIRKAKYSRAQDITAWLLFADAIFLFLFIVWFSDQSTSLKK